MRIAQIMLGKGFGGAERSFVDLTKALAGRNHAVLAVCERRAMACHHVDQISGIRHARVSVWGPWDMFARRNIMRLLQDFAPDIVQVHLARAATIAGPVVKALGIPSLAKTHNYVDLKYYRAIDHLVPTTEKQRDYLLGAGVSPARVTRIPNFSAIQPQIGDPVESNEGSLRVVAIGRLVHKKGFDVLLRACAVTLRNGYEVTLAIAGSGPQEASLIELAKSLDIQDKIQFLGWQDIVTDSLQAADLFVLPSRDEPFGIVCLEAMALGVPIVATNTDGPSEFLDATMALMVDCDDAAGLARAIEQIVDDRDAADVRAKSARAHFERHFSEPAVVDRYEALYSQLMRHV